MINRILKSRLESHPKSILLLGPRQVGKSTLCGQLKPDLSLNLADEQTFRQHLNDPGLIRRIINAMPVKTSQETPAKTSQEWRTNKSVGQRFVESNSIPDGPSEIELARLPQSDPDQPPGEATVVLVDEIQRLPSILNTIQALLDSRKNLRFLLTGSSARKLRRGRANLLPGRVILEYLPPLVYWEVKDSFNLSKALTIGALPEIYLQDYGPDVLDAYVAGYLREEIQAEALTKDLASYSRFLNIAAELSGQYMNYAKVASDSEIKKDAIRRYMEILSDTLLIELLPSYKTVDKQRRARQKDKFIFFDLGVRNSLLGKRNPAHFSREELGSLFEQWIILQVIYYNRLRHKGWRISSYRDAMGVEVDLIIETPKECVAVEVKSSQRADAKMFRNLIRFQKIAKRRVNRIVIYQGEFNQRFDSLGLAMPYQKFLSILIPNLE